MALLLAYMALGAVLENFLAGQPERLLSRGPVAIMLMLQLALLTVIVAARWPWWFRLVYLPFAWIAHAVLMLPSMLFVMWLQAWLLHYEVWSTPLGPFLAGFLGQLEDPRSHLSFTISFLASLPVAIHCCAALSARITATRV